MIGKRDKPFFLKQGEEYADPYGYMHNSMREREVFQAPASVLGLYASATIQKKPNQNVRAKGAREEQTKDRKIDSYSESQLGTTPLYNRWNTSESLETVLLILKGEGGKLPGTIPIDYFS